MTAAVLLQKKSCLECFVTSRPMMVVAVAAVVQKTWSFAVDYSYFEIVVPD